MFANQNAELQHKQRSPKEKYASERDGSIESSLIKAVTEKETV